MEQNINTYESKLSTVQGEKDSIEQELNSLKNGHHQGDCTLSGSIIASADFASQANLSLMDDKIKEIGQKFVQDELRKFYQSFDQRPETFEFLIKRSLPDPEVRQLLLGKEIVNAAIPHSPTQHKVNTILVATLETPNGNIAERATGFPRSSSFSHTSTASITRPGLAALPRAPVPVSRQISHSRVLQTPPSIQNGPALVPGSVTNQMTSAVGTRPPQASSAPQANPIKYIDC